MMNKQERLIAANEFIKAIASCGRKFFEYKGFVSTLELSPTGHVFFIDHYTKKRIYTHTRYCRWDGFTSGWTSRMIVEAMRDFITKGETMNADYFQPEMENGFKNHWGYGEDILIVRAAALKLGLAKEAKEK
jgi:hypothetical protein